MHVEYRGYKIAFNETTEQWSCDALDIHAKDMLRQVKAAIDNASKADRRLSVPALRLINNWHPSKPNTLSIEQVEVTLLCEPQRISFGRNANEIVDCWVKTSDGERSKVHISSLYPLDARTDLESYVRAKKAADLAASNAQQQLSQITSFSADTVALANKEAKAC